MVKITKMGTGPIRSREQFGQQNTMPLDPAQFMGQPVQQPMQLPNDASTMQNFPRAQPQQTMTDQAIGQLQQEASPEGYMDKVKRIGAGALAAGAEGLTALPELGGKALIGAGKLLGVDKAIQGSGIGMAENYPGYVSDNIYESDKFKQELKHQDKGAKQTIAEGLNYDNLEPQNFAERMVQGIASDLPQILLGGGALGKGLIRSAASNLGSKTAEALGLGPIAQIIAGMAGSTTANYLQNRSIGGLRGVAKKAEAKLFQDYDKYAKTAKEDKAPFEKIINSIEERYAGMSEDTKEIVKKNVDAFGNKIKTAKKLKDFTDLSESVGNTLGEATNPKAKSIYKEIYAKIQTELGNSVADHPQLENWFRAKNINLGINGSKALRKLASDDNNIKNLLKSKSLQQIFGISSIGGVANMLAGNISPKAAAISAAGALGSALVVPKISQQLARTISFMSQPETAKIAYEILKDASFGDKAAVINNLKLLNNKTKSQAQEQLVNNKEEKSNYRKYLKYAG